MALEPTHEELVSMQQTHDFLACSKKLQQEVLASRKAPRELLRRLLNPEGNPKPSKLSDLIWSQSLDWAAETLAKMKKRKKAVRMLLKALGSKDHIAVEAAMEYLGKLKLEGAVPALRQALQSSHQSTRRSAACALGDIATSEAIAALGTALQDEQIGGKAAIELLEIGSPDAVEMVTNAIIDPSLGKHLREEAYIIVSLAFRFCRHPDPVFVEAPRDLLVNPNISHKKSI